MAPGGGVRLEGLAWGREEHLGARVFLLIQVRDSDSVYCPHSHLLLSLQMPWGLLGTHWEAK